MKRYYFDKDEQVKQLQNALASQRMSQSRTSFDDNEYVMRLTRLDGLITQLAFGMRKDWKTLPAWLQPHVNGSAIATGKQEMTAVGRAFVSRWLADRVLDRHFHPGLEPALSVALKGIQRRLRVAAPPCHTVDEQDALTGRIIAWRLATVDGLQAALAAPEAALHRRALAAALEEELLQHLREHMRDAPAGAGGALELESGARMLVELAVGLLANLPLESRDVHVEYFLPGRGLDPELMRVEGGIPPLTQPAAGPASASASASASLTADAAETDGASFTTAMSDVQDEGDAHNHASAGRAAQSAGELTAMAAATQQERHSNDAADGPGRRSHEAPPPPPPGATTTTTTAPDLQREQELEQELDDAAAEGKVRLCGFLACRISGRMVLVKAPVWKA